MRVLLVEDDPAVARALSTTLNAERFNLYATDLGEEGLNLARFYDYDIILLDLNLPDMHGYELLKRLRAARVQTPVLVVSAESGVDARVRSLGYGADDHVTKPFHCDELIARIHAVIRRSRGHCQNIITTGVLALDLEARTVEIDGRRLHLTGKEYQMLELLCLRKGTAISKDMFLNHLYGGIDEPDVKIIDVFMYQLRRKLAAAGASADYIETVWARGYVLRDVDGEEAVLAA